MGERYEINLKVTRGETDISDGLDVDQYPVFVNEIMNPLVL